MTKTHLRQVTGFSSALPCSISLKGLKRVNGKRPCLIKTTSLVGLRNTISVFPNKFKIGCCTFTSDDFKRILRAADEL